MSGIEKKIRQIHKEAFESTDTVLPIGGIYKYRKTGENHQFQGKLIHTLQHAVTVGSYETFKKYTETLDGSDNVVFDHQLITSIHKKSGF